MGAFAVLLAALGIAINAIMRSKLAKSEHQSI
jgi:hypothetical protein